MRKGLRILIILGLLCGLAPQYAWAAAGGTVVVDGGQVLQLSEWAVDDIATGGKLLLSDSPEEFTQTGILYSDVVQGHARLFYHHVNRMDRNKRVAVVLENTENKPVKVTIYRKGLAGPHFDYLLTGKTAQQNYFSSQELEVLEIPAQSAEILDRKAAAARIRPQQLVNGIYDFVADGPVRVTVMAVDVHANPLAEHKKAKVLPADMQHLRGTFPFADRLKMPARVYDPNQGQQVLTLGDGVIDPFITGIDATDGSTVLNYGNYGVFYKIFIPTGPVGTDDIGFRLNPRGGVYAGALALKIDAKLWPAIGTPGDRTFLESSDTATDLVNIKQDKNLWVHFMPPGASNLPVKLIITPE
jgi:hypothetical protein